MRKLLAMQRPIYDSALMVGAIGTAAGIIITVLNIGLGMIGFEGSKPTGKVIKDLRAEFRDFKSADDLRDSVAHHGIAELKELIIQNRIATDNNTAILCFQLKSPLPLCNEILKTRGLK